MRRPFVVLIIPTWNKGLCLLQCLESVYQQTYQNFTTIIVANGSQNTTVEFLKRWSDLRVIVNTRNLGFPAAVNQGIRASDEPYIGVLNDDAFPNPEWLESLVSAMEEAPDIGSCASLMVFDHQPDIVQSAGIAMDRAAIAWDRLRGRPVNEALEECEVFGASAGAALYRRTMLEQVGLFDERFFAYLEDVDLAWRAQIAGWRCQYVPQAVVRHQTSASLGEDSPLKKQLKARNKIWMVAKNAPAIDLPLIFLYDWLAVLYALLIEGDPHPFIGRFKGLRGISPFLKDRHPGRPRLLDPIVPPWQVPQRWQAKVP
ncbi:MAG: glycosyltransferase family 2 protein [Candidatus Bathyarchaeia archaeon]